MSENPEVVEQKIRDMLDVMWKKSRATVAERMATLRTAQDHLHRGVLNNKERKEAESAAHKLAGILGTFGLPEGSAHASKVERLLARPEALGGKEERELAHWLEQLDQQIASKDKAPMVEP